MPVRIESGTVARAIKCAILLGRKFAFPVRAKGGNREQFVSPPHDKKSHVPIASIDTVRRVIAWRADTDRLRESDCITALHRFAAGCGDGRGQKQQKMSPIHVHGYNLDDVALIFKNQTRSDAPMRFIARVTVQRENEPDSQARLHAADGVRHHAKTREAKETGLARRAMVQRRFA